MKMEHREDIILTLLHTYTLSVRHLMPGRSDRALFHRLIDATQPTGYKIFEKRNDGRHFVANIQTGDGPVRVLTVYDNAISGKLDVDLDSAMPDELEDDVFVTLFKCLSIAVGITVSELASHTDKNTSALALAIAARAVNQVP